MSLLDEHEKAQPTNWRNDGRGFQKELEATMEAYRVKGIAKITKVDPPVRVFFKDRKQIVVFLKNPHLDYVGTWTARHGRMIAIEAKASDSHRLGFNSSGGLNSEQWASMKAWRHAGAAAALLWRNKAEVRLYTPEMLLSAEKLEAKSVQFESGIPVKQGVGMILWDFLAVLESQIWPVNPAADNLLV